MKTETQGRGRRRVPTSHKIATRTCILGHMSSFGGSLALVSDYLLCLAFSPLLFLNWRHTTRHLMLGHMLHLRTGAHGVSFAAFVSLSFFPPFFFPLSHFLLPESEKSSCQTLGPTAEEKATRPMAPTARETLVRPNVSFFLFQWLTLLKR